jgi:formylglycine-generating enzyme required for sulfatase activity
MKANTHAPLAAALATLLVTFITAAAFAQTNGPRTTGSRGSELEEVLGVDAALPRYHALVIGINRYQHWQSLRRARPDAEEVAGLLEQRYRFQSVTALYDEQATKRAISLALRRLAGGLGEDDALLVFYSGHGYFDKLLNRGYWVPHEAPERVDGEPATTDWFSNNELRDFITALRARHVLVVSDSCFSGSLFRGGAPDLSDKVNTWYRRAIAQPSRWGISSGDLELVPDESVFARQFLNALRYPLRPVFSASDLAGRIKVEVAGQTGTQPLFGRLQLDRDSQFGEFIFLDFGATGGAVVRQPPAREDARPPGGEATPGTGMEGERPRELGTGMGGDVTLEKPRVPDLRTAWENSLGMKFTTVAGLDGVLFGVWEARVQDFREFVNDHSRNNGYDYSKGEKPYVMKADGMLQRGWEFGWSNPGFLQTDAHPVTCVSREDAQAFCDWLTRKERAEGWIATNQSYRLPQDWEWSVAVGLNESRSGTPKDKDSKTADIYPWGSGEKPPARWGNYAGEEVKNSDWPSDYDVVSVYRDDHARTSPVGQYGATHGTLCDLGGNVWEWCEDFYDGQSGEQVLRGGSWSSNNPWAMLSSCRGNPLPGIRHDSSGFRVVLAMTSR